MNYMRGQGTFTYVDPETGKVWEKIEFDGMPYMVSKIDSTHFYMAPEKTIMDRGRYGTPHAYHVAEFKHDPNFYEELVKWLKGREMIGGKSFMESNKNEKKIIEVKEDVVIQQENGAKIILEKGDKVEILKEGAVKTPYDVQATHKMYDVGYKDNIGRTMSNVKKEYIPKGFSVMVDKYYQNADGSILFSVYEVAGRGGEYGNEYKLYSMLAYDSITELQKDGWKL